MNDEIWVDIQGYEGKYQISNIGRVKSLYLINRQGKKPREKILKILCFPCVVIIDFTKCLMKLGSDDNE